MNDEKKKALEAAILKMVRSNAIDIIVIDSVAALVPKAEIDGDMGDVHMGLQAYPEKEIFLIWRQMWILSEKVVPGILMRA